MKNHILFPLVLIVLAILVGVTSISVNYSNKNGTTTQQVANNVVDNTATVSITTVSADSSSAAASQSGARIIAWNSSSYPTNSKVTINLIRKVSDNPNSYEFVRAIASNTPNDGSESWIPASDESGDDLYIEVACAGNVACRSTGAPVKAF